MKRVVGYLSLSFVLALMVLALLSWLLSATTGDGVHSLLSSEGIRFFFGSFVDIVLQPALVWILVLAMAWGCMCKSGITGAFRKPISRRQRQSIILLMVILAVYVGVILMLLWCPMPCFSLPPAACGRRHSAVPWCLL